jgi:hypothetical protein
MGRFVHAIDASMMAGTELPIGHSAPNSEHPIIRLSISIGDDCAGLQAIDGIYEVILGQFAPSR